jgi:4-amino-4-deoxy-L-arabinose transferase-like glycosyltransferase
MNLIVVDDPIRVRPRARAEGISATTGQVLGTALIAAALLLRVPGLNPPRLTFHPTRQYRSAVIARACYDAVAPGVPEWAREAAKAARSMQPAGEPPLMEWLACGGYWLIGRETLALPRALAAIFWVLGAIPLYAIAVRVASIEGALAALAVYLFLPYGVVASRSFQPDPLMTACCLAATYAVMRYEENRGTAGFVSAAVGLAVAALVKPMSVFFTVFAAAGIWAGRRGCKRAAVSRDLYTLLALGLLPATAYYGYGAVFGTLAKDQMRMRFVPALLHSTFFWGGWITQIRRVFGLPLFAAGLAAVPLARRGLSRAVQAGLWIGYAAFAVAFTYHVPTHDYYHLPFIAAAALGVASLTDRIQRAAAARSHARSAAVAALGVAASIAVSGSIAAWPRVTRTSASDAQLVRAYGEIGDLVRHDTRVVFLDHEYGYPLMYHGQLSGDAWPNTDDLAAESLGGAAPLDAESRFARDYADFNPRYFVVTDLASLEGQPDLIRLLDKRATAIAETAVYRVYRFRD